MRPIDGADVLAYLIPTGGWTITGDDFDSITYDQGVKPLTKKQFEDGFALATAAKAATEAAKAAASISAIAKLEAIGLTAQEIAALRG